MMPQTMTCKQAAQWLKARVAGELSCDSRRVAEGDGFVAWPGAATDGRRFVASALQSGAVAALVEQEGIDAFELDPTQVVAVNGLKSCAGEVGAIFYDHPSQHLDMVAVTGTNGKTSTTWWMAQLLSAAGRPSGLVGTLGIGSPSLGDGTSGALEYTGLTTPDPIRLQAKLRDMVDRGISACAIEASSIGIDEGRLNATEIHVGVLTNVTQDHLDFHGTMQSYWAAKRKLFQWSSLRTAVLNVDDGHARALSDELAAEGRVDIWTVALKHPARLGVEAWELTPNGMRWRFVEQLADGQSISSDRVAVPFVGDYNLSNLLCVAAAARALGLTWDAIVSGFARLSAVPGRMEAVGESEGQPLVLVDYAHTPDALEKALSAARPVATRRGGRLCVIAGCGGDRDRSKRPLMAAAAERLADVVVLTSDNPRSESPEAILADMVAGLQHPQNVAVVKDRAEAIAQTIARASPADVVIIAGKGHEDYQEVQGVRQPFSDQAHARVALGNRQRLSGVEALKDVQS